MSSSTSYGMMTVYNDGVISVGNDTTLGIIANFASQPRGSLYLKNLTTGFEVRIAGRDLVNDRFTYFYSKTDDPAATINDTFIIEFSGKADNLRIGTNVAGNVIFDGNGAAEVQGVGLTTGE